MKTLQRRTSHRVRRLLIGSCLFGSIAASPIAVGQDPLVDPPAEVANGAIDAIEAPSTTLAVDEAEPIVPTPAVSGISAPDSDVFSSDASANGELRFSFNGTPWREVIRWVADQSGLALHVGDLPPGSFTYSDASAYEVSGAIDRINLFLLAEGYTLVRSGQLLSVINLGDPRSLQQLDLLAKQIPVESLEDMPSNHEVVKCIFALGEIEADDAVDELAALSLMSSPKVLSKTNQLMITDTVAKLRNVRDVLSAFEPSFMDNGTVVKTFSLQHVEAEDVLLVARPHLGLATGEMIGIDVSLSADLLGKHIFVTGVEDKVKVIERLVESIDQPKSNGLEIGGEMTLQSHLVEGGNVDTVYNVLQTLLSGKTVRLSVDKDASSIVALATADVQKQIQDTVKQVQASDAVFEVIPLNHTDPYFVITLLEQMLDLPSPLDDPDDVDPAAPRIDADPGNKRLFVRAKRHELDQIRTIVDGLESSAAASANPTNHAADSLGTEQVRVIPIKGQRAEDALETAATFWRSGNPVIVYPTLGGPQNSTERVPAKKNDGSKDAAPNETKSAKELAFRTHAASMPAASPHRDAGPRQLTVVSNAKAPTIRCQVTPQGILLQSDDTEALDRFESHLKTIAGPADLLPPEPVVFYLQHCRPDDALRILGELLEGGQSAREGEAGTLVNGYVSGGPSGSYLSMISSREGTTTMMAGSITVVADSRLNRLIVQGTAEDIEEVAGYLTIIDKDESIASIETYGRSKVIELQHTKAADVADSIRDAFVGRVAEDTKSQNGAAGPSSLKGGVEPRPTTAAAKAAAAKQAAKEEPARNLEPKMTVAVHEATNSLIITAPEALLAEVESLIERIDSRGEQAVEVITPMNSEIYGLLLQQLTSDEKSTGAIRSTAKPASTSRSTSSRGR
ncbi:secretin N-terminal domain-containing protein [Rubripirellula reticaptiva]|nr:secretin N-terminal domain-containing protein [Rubripirellula reticaptiva]